VTTAPRHGTTVTPTGFILLRDAAADHATDHAADHAAPAS
jgi:hypothetical protein